MTSIAVYEKRFHCLSIAKSCIYNQDVLCFNPFDASLLWLSSNVKAKVIRKLVEKYM